MIIFAIAIIIFSLVYILINIKNRKSIATESFTQIYDSVNNYLSAVVDNKVLRNSNCYDNDKMIAKITGNINATCASEYASVDNIYYKPSKSDYEENLLKTDNQKKIYYDLENEKPYSFAELCPITTKQLNGTMCLRNHNAEISDVLYRINNLTASTNNKLNDTLNDLHTDFDDYSNNKYRKYNDTTIQNYLKNK